MKDRWDKTVLDYTPPRMAERADYAKLAQDLTVDRHLYLHDAVYHALVQRLRRSFDVFADTDEQTKPEVFERLHMNRPGDRSGLGVCPSCHMSFAEAALSEAAGVHTRHTEHP